MGMIMGMINVIIYVINVIVDLKIVHVKKKSTYEEE